MEIMEISWSRLSDLGRITLAAAIASVCAYMYSTSMLKFFRKRPKLPPKAAYGFPTVGCLPSLIMDKQGLHHFTSELRRLVGDIFRIQLGVHEVVFVFGHKYVQEAAGSVGRPASICIPHKIIKEKGIIWNQGECWRELRSLFKAAQEDAKIVSALQRHFTEELGVFRTHVKDESSSLDLEFLITQTSFNFISSFLFGKRYDYDDPDMIEIRDRLTELGDSTATANVENFLPFLAMFSWSKLRKASNNKNFLFKKFREMMQEKTDSPVDPPTDFLQFYLSRSTKGDPGVVTETDVLQALIDMFAAGKDNLLLSSKWMLMALVKYPDVQAKCRSEIQQVIGQGQTLLSEDRSRTPYTSATIKEIQRMYSPVPFTIFHCAEKEMKVGKYDIPKDTLMMLECKAPGMDEEFWTDPKDFNPNRFLDVDVDRQRPEGCFTPYGPGPRYCIGKYMAEIFLYTFVANVLQHFEVTANIDGELSFSNKFNKFGLTPKHFDEIILKSV